MDKKAKKSDTRNKQGKILFCSMVLVVIFVYGYKELFKLTILKLYSPYYFARVGSYFSVLAVAFAALCFFTVVFYILPDRKMSNSKYLINSGIIVSIAFVLTIVCSFNVWVFNENTVSYNTLFQKDKIVYTYDCIKSVELSVEESSRMGGGTHLNYHFKMDDGEEITMDISDAYFKNEKDLIDFDKKISDKRKVIGEYGYFGNKSDEFNDYYRFLFKNAE